DLAVGRDGQPVAAAFDDLVPDHFPADDIERRHAADGCDIDSAGLRACRDALDILRLFARGNGPRWDALDEPVPIVHIENQDSDAAILHIVADARCRDIEQVLFLRAGALEWRKYRDDADQTLQ